MADLFKFGCWSFSFIVLAHLSSRSYFLLELLWGTVLLGTVWLSLRSDQLLALGYSHLIAYSLYALATFWTVRRQLNIRLERGNTLLLLMLGLSCSVVVLRETWSVLEAVSIVLVLIWLIMGVRYLRHTLLERNTFRGIS